MSERDQGWTCPDVAAALARQVVGAQRHDYVHVDKRGARYRRRMLTGPTSHSGQGPKVLVTVASRHGGTDEIGRAIADALTEAGVQADLIAPSDVERLQEYDGVIVGSAVYVGKWLEPARQFIEQHTDVLKTKPVWLFSSGPLGDPPRPIEESVDALQFAERVAARDHRTFSGRLDANELGLGERALVRLVKASYGDFRPWPEIRTWVEEIVGQLRDQSQ